MTGISAKTRFAEFISVESTSNLELPFVHITDGYHLPDILEPKCLKVTPCKVFGRDILYMFYGKPAYRTKHSGTNFLSCHLPCAFIFKPDVLSGKIRAVYPFDTGAFFANMYSAFFHQDSQIEDFMLPPSLTSIKQVVQKFYRSNEEYFHGGSRKNIDIPPMNFEAEGYLELSRAPSHPEANSRLRADERASAIEIHFHEDVSLKNSLEACVLPLSFLDNVAVKKSLEILNPDIIKTYTAIHKHSYEAIAGKIYEIVESIYRDKKYIS
jgi:hypothetical protein